MLTLLDTDGSYKVYKGYCVKPHCFTLDQAKRLAGDVVVSSDPRRRHLQRKSSRNISASKLPNGHEGDSDNDSSPMAHKRSPDAFPPLELRNTANFEIKEDAPLFMVEKAVEGLQQNSKSILILELSGIQLRKIDFEALAEGLKVNSTLSGLVLENSKLDDQNLSIIASGLEQASDIPINKLYLRSNQIGDAGIDALGPFLQANNTLEKLDLARNSVTSHGAMAIFSAFHHNRSTKIRTINLSHNSLWVLDDDMTGVGPFLAKNRSLRILNLEGNNLNDESVHAMAAGLKSNEHAALERLYLGWNAFGDDGTIALAEMLEMNMSLRVLGLGENQIHNAGARALLAATDRNFTLKEISGLWRNKIERRFIIVAIRRLLLSADRSDAVRTKLYEQALSNNVECMASMVDLDTDFDEPLESSRVSAEAGTTVSTMSNDLDPGDLSTTTTAEDDEMPLRRGRKASHARGAKQAVPKQVEGVMDADISATPMDETYDRLVILHSTPLVTLDRETGVHHPIPIFDVDHESFLIQQALGQSVVGKIDTEVEVATKDTFTAFFEQPQSSILHISCNVPKDHLELEDGFGSSQMLPPVEMKRLATHARDRLQVVVVSSQKANAIGQMLVDAGVPHVVCCKLDHRYRDLVGMEFVQNLYRALASKKSLKHAFQIARSAASGCSHARVLRRVAERFQLLPERGEKDSFHNIPVFFAQPVQPREAGKDEAPTETQPSNQLPALPHHFLGREMVIFEMLEALRVDDIVRIIGSPGCGKDSVVAAACRYARKRRDAFNFDEIFWLPAPEGVVPEEDTLYADLCNCINFLRNAGTDNEEEEDDTVLDRIEIELENLQILLVVDERQFQYRTAQSALEKFISFALNVGASKILLLENRSSADNMSSVSNFSHDTTGQPFDEATIEVVPLDFKPTAQLFGEASKFITSSAIPAAHDAAEFSELLEPSYLRNSELNSSELFSQRRSDLFARMGNGLPVNVLKAASTMPKGKFIELIGIANRPEVFVDSLGALDLEIRRRNFQKSKAVDDKNYLRAMDLDTLLEELESMRPEFPTIQDLKEEQEIMKADLDAAVASRRYDVANELKRELLSIRKKIIKEQRSTNASSSKKGNAPSDMVRDLEAQVQNMVLKSRTRDSFVNPSTTSAVFDPNDADAAGRPGNGETTFAVACGDHRDCSFTVHVGDVLDFSHPAEARGIVVWTNECCQLEGTVQGEDLLRRGGPTLRQEISELPVAIKTTYGPVRCATGNAVIVGPAQFGTLDTPCIILAVGPLSPSRALSGEEAKISERRKEEEEFSDELWLADALDHNKPMLRSCYRSSMVLAKHAELQVDEVRLRQFD